MALLDIFKKKKDGEKKAEKITEKPKETPTSPKKKHFFDGSYRVLKTPRISEKATNLLEGNQYTFKVYKNSSKQEVKRAVESIYGVEVESIKVVNLPGKKRRLGKFIGWQIGYKKAIVKIKEGQKIEVLPR